MKTQEAILQILAQRSGPTKYALAKKLKVQPIMINHYLNGSRMRQDKADIFEEVFGIKINDVYAPTQDALQRMKHDSSDT